MKRTIKLRESELRRMIDESVKRALNEVMSPEDKWAADEEPDEDHGRQESRRNVGQFALRLHLVQHRSQDVAESHHEESSQNRNQSPHSHRSAPCMFATASAA